MAIAARTVSINAAFLQEIKEDHHELRQLMHHTGAMLNRPEWLSIERDQLVELICKLRDQLAIHFSLEEAYGYFNDALEAAPHLSRRAERLQAQHGELYSELCELADLSEKLLYHETPDSTARSLAGAFQNFSRRFHAHKQHENELILEALTEDLGEGD